jgi:hypothetical protein
MKAAGIDFLAADLNASLQAGGEKFTTKYSQSRHRQGFAL